MTAKYERNVDEFDYLNIMSDMIKVIGGYFENSKFCLQKIISVVKFKEIGIFSIVIWMNMPSHHQQAFLKRWEIEIV